MLSALGRAAVRRVTGGAPQSASRVCYQLQRVSLIKDESEKDGNKFGLFAVALRRSYATATSAATKRPRATAAKTGAKKATTKKAAPKKAAKKKPAKKVVKKPKKKVAKKVVPKKRVKKVPSEQALARKSAIEFNSKIRELKEKALYQGEPKQLPSTAWMVYYLKSMTSRAGTGAGVSAQDALSASAKAAAESFRTLSVAEREQLNHEANSNKATNLKNYTQWVTTHAPDQIREANNSRTLLKRIAKDRLTAGEKKPLLKTSDLTSIRDDRLVKRMSSAFVFFSSDRWASGDLKGVSITDASRRIAEEWRALSASEKQTFENQATADKQRYVQEFLTVYGHEPSKS